MTELPAAVEAVRARALALYEPGDEFGVATDTTSYAYSKGKPPAVLVGLALPTGSVVLAIDAAEFDGEILALRLGWKHARPPTAHELAQLRLTQAAAKP